ncbi:SAND-like [Achlya hypogyna]|uniref:SAND-like n=1 Tax=Achlya hypogyna TaxID=1202772 RepID=A0A1V9YRK8_ACHHY|nr:SAND-like [Achlya hypogyna]
MQPEVHVLSAAGKPIFSTAAPDDGAHASLSGLIQGISSFSKDTLRVIKTKATTLHFLPCPPLLFFCAVPRHLHGLNVSRLLHLIKHHVLFFLTENGLRLVESNPNYDLRHLLQGTEGLLASLTRSWTETVWAQIDASGIRVWPMTEEARQTLQCSMDAPGLLFGLLLRHDHVLAYRQGHKDHPLPIEDIHVLSHVVRHMPSFRTTESWTPICLPSFNSAGFVYAYIVFTTLDICTILISTNESQTQFHTFQDLHNEHISRALIQLVSTSPPIVALTPLPISHYLPPQYQPLLVHFLYQHGRTHQVVYPSFQGLDDVCLFLTNGTDATACEDPAFQQEILRHYHTLHRHLHGADHRSAIRRVGVASPKDSEPVASVYFFRTDTLLVMGRVLEKQAGIIYICCEALVTAEDADVICDRLVARVYNTAMYSL